jgi:hypothetical protein
MNRRLSGDASLNVAIREDCDSGEWQDWLVDESPDQETMLAASEEFDEAKGDVEGVHEYRAHAPRDERHRGLYQHARKIACSAHLSLLSWQAEPTEML